MIVKQSAYTVVTITTTRLSHHIQTAVGLSNTCSPLSLSMQAHSSRQIHLDSGVIED